MCTYVLMHYFSRLCFNIDACDAPSRLKLLKKKLDNEVSNKAIICLQEVSTLWSGDLHTYFAGKGYAFITGHQLLYYNRHHLCPYRFLYVCIHARI